MPSCSVPFCKSGYKDTTEIHYFTPKSDEQLALWQKAIQRKDFQLTRKSRVCSLHFDSDLYDTFHRVQMPDGSCYSVKRKRATLKDGAVPSIFPGYPKYCLPKVTKERKPRERKEIPQKSIVIDVIDESAASASSGLTNTAHVMNNATDLEQRGPTDDCATPANIVLPDETEHRPNSKNRTPSVPDVTARDDERVPDNDNIPVPHDPYWSMIYDKMAEHLELWFYPLQESSVDLSKWEYCKSRVQQATFFLQFDSRDRIMKKIVLYRNTPCAKVYFGDIEINLDPSVTTMKNKDDVLRLLDTVHKLAQCPGPEKSLLESERQCRGYLDRRSTFCAPCTNYGRRCSHVGKEKALTTNRRLKNVRRQNKSLRKKLTSLQQRMSSLQKACAKTNVDDLTAEIQKLNLHTNLKENILSCINVAKMSSPRSIHYSRAWLFECVLLKIKNRNAYVHIQRHKMMALPSLATINRYLRRLKPVYGFQSGIFEMMKKKASQLSPMEREGSLLIDEMSLRESYDFNKQSLKIVGFTDLGNHTPEHQKNLLGNHGLVFVFQPFQGDWIQAIGSFLSRGAAASEELYQLVMEAIILLENSGYHVNSVVTDGAAWNRGMWKKFHISQDQVSCAHITDEDRRIWFISDFPHLIKNLRNWMTDMCGGSFETPDGKVKLSHWETILHAERDPFKLQSVSYKLTDRHLHPKRFEKMNVALAYQIFDDRVADAMEMYKDKGEAWQRKSLQDCNGSVAFVKRMRKLIRAMSSRTPIGALRLTDMSTERKDIEAFTTYLVAWKAMFPPLPAPKRQRQRRTPKPVSLPINEPSTSDGQKIEEELPLLDEVPPTKKLRLVDELDENVQPNESNPPKRKRSLPSAKFLTDSTYLGLLVTLRSTIEILNYLVEKCGYRYLMTSRLNQDNLERFFGMIRSAGGNNDHPSSVNFLYIYRLMSAYSLLKPHKGSNVTGEENFSSFCDLMQDNTIIGQVEEPMTPHDQWMFQLDSAVSRGIPDIVFPEDQECAEKTPSHDIAEYFSGYILHQKNGFFNKCQDCIGCLTGSDSNPDSLLSKRNKFGVLKIPAKPLVYLLECLEDIITKEVRNLSDLKPDTFFCISEKIDDECCLLPLVGCSQHQDRITMFIVQFFLITRMNMICKAAKKLLTNAGKSKELKKSSKLVS